MIILLKKCLLLVLFLGLSSLMNGQRTATIDSLKRLDGRQNQVNHLVDYFENLPQDSFYLKGKASYALAYRYEAMGKLDSMYVFVEEGLSVFSGIKYLGYEVPVLTEYKGSYHRKKQDLETAYSIYDHFEGLSFVDDRAIGAFVLSKIGQSQICRELGDNDASIQILEYLEDLEMMGKAYYLDKLDFYIEMAIAYGFEANDERDSISHHYLKMAEGIAKSEKQKLKVLFQKGILLYNASKYDESKLVFEEVLSRRLLLGDGLSKREAFRSAVNIGQIYIDQENYSSGASFMQKHITLIEEQKVTNSLKMLFRSNYNVLLQKSQREDELVANRSAINKLLNDKEKLSTINPSYIGEYLMDEAYFEYKVEGNTEKALEISEDATKYFQKYLESLLTDYSKQVSLKKIDKHYKFGLDLAVILNDQKRFYYFSELSKNALLFQSKRNSNVDLSKEFDILKLIEKNPLDTTLQIELQLERKKNINRLFSSRKNTESADLLSFSDFKYRIGDAVCLNFSFGSSKLYVQKLQSGQDSIFTFSIFPNEEQVKDFRTGISSLKPLENYALFENVFSALILAPEKSDFVIIPDEYLFLYPFDLEVQKYNSSSVRYLLRASQAKAVEGHIDVNDVLLVNPKYTSPPNYVAMLTSRSGSELVELPYSYDEVDNIEKVIKEKHNTRGLSKKDILKRYRKTDVFHYSGHSVMERDNNFTSLPLGESGEYVYAYEIDAVDTDAAMVVLSACETASGATVEGEGVFSLTRNFVNSGARSVISTLWPVDDESTSIILSSFYDHLANGLSKGVALSKAKEDFLSSCPDYQKHPYFWSGIILTGDNSPLLFSKKNNWLYLLTISLLVLFFIGFGASKMK